MTYTLGPYTITGPSLDAGRDGDAGDYAIWADGRHIGDAICHTFGTLGVDHYEDALANARLWKAAPDLLEACEAGGVLWRHYTRCPECQGTVFCPDALMLAATANSLRAFAIAKAKGEDND